MFLKLKPFSGWLIPTLSGLYQLGYQKQLIYSTNSTAPEPYYNGRLFKATFISTAPKVSQEKVKKELAIVPKNRYHGI
ncbi:MAG: hypothetical protein OEL85_03070, partial [Desulfobulbaceae bacterium]|nr:hypothetical protein [Desulfobulbaceae bacterium]